MGIGGSNNHNWESDLSSFVLGKFSDKEQKLLNDVVIPEVCKIINNLLQ